MTSNSELNMTFLRTEIVFFFSRIILVLISIFKKILIYFIYYFAFSSRQLCSRQTQTKVSVCVYAGETGSSHSSRNASVERGPGRDRQSDTSDSETTDIRRINHQPGTRDGRYDPNR